MKIESHLKENEVTVYIKPCDCGHGFVVTNDSLTEGYIRLPKSEVHTSKIRQALNRRGWYLADLISFERYEGDYTWFEIGQIKQGETL